MIYGCRQESLLSLKSRIFGLGQTNKEDKFGGFWHIFGQNISTHDFPVELYSAVGANLDGMPELLYAEV